MEALIGFGSGVVVTLVGALAGAALQRSFDRRKQIKDVQFQVYMKLMNVWNLYFWVASLELRDEEVEIDHKRRIQEEAWRIADLLRAEDEVPFADQILQILMSNEYPSASNRHSEMSEILDKLGAITNPRYQRVIKAISDANVRRIGSGHQDALKSTTPGSMVLL